MENVSCLDNRQHDDIYKDVYQFRKKVHSWLSEQSKEDQNQEKLMTSLNKRSLHGHNEQLDEEQNQDKSVAPSEKRISHSSRKSYRKSSRA